MRYLELLFGLGYGIGSIGSWILSLAGNGNFFQSRYVLITYVVLTGISIVLYISMDSVDLAGKCESNLFLAGLGLMFGRAGDVVGATLGICLVNRISLLVILTAIVLIITIFVFFVFYQKMYFPLLPEEKNTELLLEDFSQKHGLSINLTIYRKPL